MTTPEGVEVVQPTPPASTAKVTTFVECCWCMPPKLNTADVCTNCDTQWVAAS